MSLDFLIFVNRHVKVVWVVQVFSRIASLRGSLYGRFKFFSRIASLRASLSTLKSKSFDYLSLMGFKQGIAPAKDSPYFLAPLLGLPHTPLAFFQIFRRPLNAPGD